MRRLEAQKLDVVIVSCPVREPTTASITPLIEGRMMLAVGLDSKFAGRSEVALIELAGEPLILHSRTQAPNLHLQTMEAFRQAGVQPNVAQEAAQIQTILRLVESGIGVGLVADFVADHTGNGVQLLRIADRSTTAAARPGIGRATRSDHPGDAQLHGAGLPAL